MSETTNYDARTKIGRRNILKRIFEDNGIEFSCTYEFNSEPWVDRLFNGGRSYQRALDEKHVLAHFKDEAYHALGSRKDPYESDFDSSEIPKWLT